MKMFGSVLVLRGITTADVAAAHAQPEMHPFIAGLQTLLASMRVRNDFLDLGEMCTLVHNSNVQSFGLELNGFNGAERKRASAQPQELKSVKSVAG